MDQATLYIILLVAAIVVLPMVLRYLLNAGVNKGSDAIKNRVAEKKNESMAASDDGPKRLADRYQGL